MPADTIRLAAASDAARLAEIHVITWRAAYAGILAPDFLDQLDVVGRAEWWERFITKGSEVLVSEDHDAVSGFCYAAGSSEEGWGEIFSIYVHPDWWSRGHGKALLAAGEQRLADMGFDQALLWVLRDNIRARRFYDAHRWATAKPIRLEDIGGVQVTELRYEKSLLPDP